MQEFKVERPGRMSNTDLRALFQSCPNLTTLDLHIYPHTGAYDDIDSVLRISFLSLTKLVIFRGAATTTALRDIFTYCTNIREVHLEDCAFITDEMLKVLIQHSRKLEKLHLLACKKITIAGLLEVATDCSTLVFFNLLNMPISNEVFVRLSMYCIGLRGLWVESCYVTNDGVREEGILDVVDKCKKLTSLRVMGVGLEMTHALEDLMRGGMYKHIRCDIRS